MNMKASPQPPPKEGEIALTPSLWGRVGVGLPLILTFA